MKKDKSKKFDYKKYPDRVNLGCGFDIIKDFLNIDKNAFHKPDLTADVRDLPMLPSGYYKEVLAQDVLEHLERGETIGALREWNRLLKDGGLLKIRVPNLVELLDLLSMKYRYQTEKQRELVRCLYGTQAYNGDYHQTGFTKLLLGSYLKECGFGILKMATKDKWMIEVLAKKYEGVAVENSEADLLDDWLFLEGWYDFEMNGGRGYRWGVKRAYLNIMSAVERTVSFDIFTNYPGVSRGGVEVIVIDRNSEEVLRKINLSDYFARNVIFRCKKGQYIVELFVSTSWIPKYWLSSDDDRELGVGLTNLILR